MRQSISSKRFNLEITLKIIRQKRVLTNFALFLVATATHVTLQTILGCLIAGLHVTKLPETSITTLVILVFAFLTIAVCLLLQPKRILLHHWEKSLTCILPSILLCLSIVLTSRMHYDGVFLFWGLILQIILCALTLLIYEKTDKKIIGISDASFPDFVGLIPANMVRTIMPDRIEVTELDMIILKNTQIASPEWSSLIAKCEFDSIEIEEHMVILERLARRIDPNQIQLSEMKYFAGNKGYLIFKRILDILFSVLLLVVLLPVMLITAILISYDSAGGPIYRQQRVGLGGKPFTIYKFRTMEIGSEGGKARFAEQNDGRITRVGSVMRRIRLDELPQLLNVLIGQMSLIGPRPEQLELIGNIQQEIPAFSLRHSIRPGITGWAQVQQGYTDTIAKAHRKLSYDLWYVRNVSIWLDLLIAFRTMQVVVMGFGSR